MPQLLLRLRRQPRPLQRASRVNLTAAQIAAVVVAVPVATIAIHAITRTKAKVLR
jgi:hypothetical protein